MLIDCVADPLCGRIKAMLEWERENRPELSSCTSLPITPALFCINWQRWRLTWAAPVRRKLPPENEAELPINWESTNSTSALFSSRAPPLQQHMCGAHLAILLSNFDKEIATVTNPPVLVTTDRPPPLGAELLFQSQPTAESTRAGATTAGVGDRYKFKLTPPPPEATLLPSEPRELEEMVQLKRENALDPEDTPSRAETK
jgi:hypothetical protein